MYSSLRDLSFEVGASESWDVAIGADGSTVSGIGPTKLDYDCELLRPAVRGSLDSFQEGEPVAVLGLHPHARLFRQRRLTG